MKNIQHVGNKIGMRREAELEREKGMRKGGGVGENCDTWRMAGYEAYEKKKCRMERAEGSDGVGDGKRAEENAGQD